MKYINRKIISVFCLVFILLNIFSVSLADTDGLPEGFDSWEDYYNSLIYGGGAESVEVPEFDAMILAGENSSFKMYFHEEGLDFYIIDKASGKLWSTAVHPDYMDTGGKPDSEISALFELILMSGAEGIESLYLTKKTSEDFEITAEINKNAVLLHISIPAAEISFDFDARLTADGFSVNIPESSIVEKGEMKLFSMNFLPAFGAASPKEEGYIFYPDGSGALIDIKPGGLPDLQAYTYPLYGQTEQNIESLAAREEQGIKNLMLPVFGIKHSEGGFLAAITGGDSTAELTMSIADIYKASFKFNYRTYASAKFTYTGSAFNQREISKLLPERIPGDRGVRYFLLDRNSGNYSGMAVKYRDYLEKSKVLIRQKEKPEIPLSVDFFMAAAKSGFVGSKIEALTTYAEAAEILTDLSESGVDCVQTLLTGWSKGGYDARPTSSAFEPVLGGKSSFNRLVKAVNSTGGTLFAGVDYLTADKKYGKFNLKKDILRDLLGAVVTDKSENLYLLNPTRTLLNNTKTALTKANGNWLLSFMKIGQTAIANNNENDIASRQRVIESYREALKLTKKQQGKGAVSGGNYYALPYADRLYEIPDSDSEYYQNSRWIPFYQIVLHGYADYTSLAGNASYSLQAQKLRWIETGSLPHFQITHESPALLRDTSYNKIFSSEFNDWREILIETYKEFNERLGDVWNQRVISHEILNNGLIKIIYENDTRVFINYTAAELTAEGLTVPPADYIVAEVGR